MLQQLPPALLATLQTAKGFNEAAFIAVHQSGEQVVSVRMNPAKKNSADIGGLLQGRVPWTSNGYYLESRPSFTLDPAFHAGAYYVQEASSMFLEEALRQSCDLSQPLKVLDLCAAPGGKSTLIQSVISEDSLLVSNEVIKTRVNILSENMTKWGGANVVVTNNDPKDFQRLQGFFEVIVVDAPCSGSGLFRKDPEAMDEWSLANVELCSQRQQRILADILPALKEGGVLVYSTCSYSEKEDEAICDWLLANEQGMQTIPLKLQEDWNIVTTTSPTKDAFGYRFYPDKLKGEGFFIAAFTKQQYTATSILQKPKAKPAMATKAEEEIIASYLLQPERFSFLKLKEDVIVFPSVQFDSLLQLQSTLYLKKAGVKAGSIIRGELLPDHELAVSTILSEKITRVNVEKSTALDYLRRKDIQINELVKGWSVIQYDALPLGLAKILPNRVNNYYPREWRIINK